MRRRGRDRFRPAVARRVSAGPQCTCGGSICGTRGKRYICVGCKRDVPWCFGAADDMPEHCDDCWSVAQP